jgi:hypothetical protein
MTLILHLMALTSITLNNRASVVGRALARNGAVTLDANVLNGSVCGAATTPDGSTPAAGNPGGTAESPIAAIGPGTGGTIQVGTVNKTPPTSQATVPTRNGTAILRPTTLTSSVPDGSSRQASCAAGFRATVTGRHIKRVVFSLDGTRITSRSTTPFRVFVRALTGTHSVTARSRSRTPRAQRPCGWPTAPAPVQHCAPPAVLRSSPDEAGVHRPHRIPTMHRGSDVGDGARRHLQRAPVGDRISDIAISHDPGQPVARRAPP